MEELGSTAVVEMHPGDVFAIETPGAGGDGKLEIFIERSNQVALADISVQVQLAIHLQL